MISKAYIEKGAIYSLLIVAIGYLKIEAYTRDRSQDERIASLEITVIDCYKDQIKGAQTVTLKPRINDFTRQMEIRNPEMGKENNQRVPDNRGNRSRDSNATCILTRDINYRRNLCNRFGYDRWRVG